MYPLLDSTACGQDPYLAILVCGNASHVVVHSRAHRDRLLRNVNTSENGGSLGDARQSLVQNLCGLFGEQCFPDFSGFSSIRCVTMPFNKTCATSVSEDIQMASASSLHGSFCTFDASLRDSALQ